jgi:hypothetical protein
MISGNDGQNKITVNQPTPSPSTLSGRVEKDHSKVVKEWIIIGLIIVGIGLFVYSFGTEFSSLEEAEDGVYIDFIGKLTMKIGMIISSILLIYFALFMERYDVTLRFGCLLVAGIIIAFQMLSFV